MTIRAIYVPDDETRHWDELTTIASRRGLSLSKQVRELVKNYVEENHSGRDLGLPVGFAIPESMKDPRVRSAEEAADDIRERALRAMLDVWKMGGAS